MNTASKTWNLSGRAEYMTSEQGHWDPVTKQRAGRPGGFAEIDVSLATMDKGWMVFFVRQASWIERVMSIFFPSLL